MVGLIAPAVGFALGIFAKREGYDATDFLPNIDLSSEDFIVTTEAEIAAETLIKQRESLRLKVYVDTTGNPTVGWGHKVLPRDKLNVGDVISQAQAQDFFAVDFDKAFEAGRSQAREAGLYVPQVIAALASVNFQLGTGWRRKFPKTWQKIVDGDIKGAINRIKTTLWHQQTPKRTNDLIAALNSATATG